MQGYQLTFFMELNSRHGTHSLSGWLIEFARSHGAPGATVYNAGEGFGAAGKLHSAGFFELVDQPVGVMVSGDGKMCDALLAALDAEEIDIFYYKTPVEYGRIGRKRREA
jgi:PII-like signaling protein